MSRTRVKTSGQRKITYTNSGGGVVSVETTWENQSTCTDSTGFPVDHDLDLAHETLTGGDLQHWQVPVGYANGLVGAGGNQNGWYDSTISSFVGTINAQKIAAATAPLKPSVSNLTNLIEFRDIPRMLEHAGDLLHDITRLNYRKLSKVSELASSTLAYQFGWAPLLQDIWSMMNFGQAVLNRQRSLAQINSGQVLHRRASFGTISGSKQTSNETIHSTNGLVLSANFSYRSQVDIWGTVRWSLNPNSPLLGYKPSWLTAFNQLYGLTPGEIPIQVWKALPWTWCIDWFANVSQAMEVTRNMLYYTPSHPCVMWTDVRTHNGVVTNNPPNPGASVKPFAYVAVVKKRKVLPSNFTGLYLTVPFLDTYKLSVISSLLVLKLSRNGTVRP